MQLYYDDTRFGTGVKLLIIVNKVDLYLLTDIVNDKTDGWHYNHRSPTAWLLKLLSVTTLNPLFVFSLSNVDLSSAFMF